MKTLVVSTKGLPGKWHERTFQGIIQYFNPGKGFLITEVYKIVHFVVYTFYIKIINKYQTLDNDMHAEAFRWKHMDICNLF